jgi:hypothetical protein
VISKTFNESENHLKAVEHRFWALCSPGAAPAGAANPPSASGLGGFLLFARNTWTPRLVHGTHQRAPVGRSGGRGGCMQQPEVGGGHCGAQRHAFLHRSGVHPPGAMQPYARLAASRSELSASPSELLPSPSELFASPSELLASPSELSASPGELLASPGELFASANKLLTSTNNRPWVLHPPRTPIPRQEGAHLAQNPKQGDGVGQTPVGGVWRQAQHPLLQLCAPRRRGGQERCGGRSGVFDRCAVSRTSQTSS